MSETIFNSIQVSAPPRNTFDLSHSFVSTGNMGELLPITAIEVLPGDKINIASETLIRFQPLVSPVMHQINAYVHYFFVPNRLLWDEWEQYINGKLEVEHPYVTITDTHLNPPRCKAIQGMGAAIPTDSNQVQLNAMPFAAYKFIYNEYYRPQDIQAEANYKLISGDNDFDGDGIDLYYRGYEHDYFTSALPFAQRGAAVEIPLSFNSNVPIRVNNANSTEIQTATQIIPLQGSNPLDPNINPNELYGDIEGLSNDTTITDLRRAFKLQEFLELSARSGNRYTEYIYAIFGVRSSDARLQRPEYITGSKSPVQISEVLNNTGTENAPQGAMAGHAISYADGNNGEYFAEEHGWIIGILSIMPKPTYKGFTQKSLFKINDRFDYYVPQFAHIGEQEVLHKEITPDAVNPDGILGYVPRYSEYKYQASRVGGDIATTLDFWTMARNISETPTLAEVLFANPTTMTNIFAVEPGEQDTIIFQVLNHVYASRLMSKYGNPMF